MAVLELDAPLPGLQAKWLNDPRARKVLCIGRRGSKTAGCWQAALLGHGEGDDLHRALPGIFSGRDVFWFAQDYPNLLKTVWDTYIVPTFKDKPYADLNEQQHTLTIQDRGTLYLQSAEAASSAKGVGKNLAGVILDEAAHFDLQFALHRVVLPALLDNHGWLILSSTTNSGWDGNAERRVPSRFNEICDEIAAGQKPGWALFEGTAFDNPLLDQDAIQELIAEYANDPLGRDEEIYAKRLAPGGGQALAQLNRTDHFIEPIHTERWWTWWGALDWGFNHPWAFGLFCEDDRGLKYLVDSVFGRGDLPDVQADQIKALCSLRGLSVNELFQIAYGWDIKNARNQVQDNTPKVIEVLIANGVTRLVPANIDRPQGLNNLRWEIATRDAAGNVKTPNFRIFNHSSANARVYDTLERMILDPKRPEDVLKVNAIAGKGGDEGYDVVRYGLAARPYQAQAPDDGVLEDINAPEVLLHEWTEKRRAGNVKSPVQDHMVPRRMAAETDPNFGDF